MGRHMEWAGRMGYMWGIPRKMLFVAVGAFAKAVANVLNTTTVHNADTLIRLVQHRPPGVPLVTVSNHMSTIDDPVMWGFKGFPTSDATLGRWVLAAEDICFKNVVLSYLFRLGKCIPVTRGAGIHQEYMDEALEHLRNGEWLHTFPEGKVTQDDVPIRRLKWGTASLIVRSPITPIVLPIVHRGFDEIMPENSLFGRRPPVPLCCKKIEIIVGEPIQFDIPSMKQMAISMSRNWASPLGLSFIIFFDSQSSKSAIIISAAVGGCRFLPSEMVLREAVLTSFFLIYLLFSSHAFEFDFKKRRHEIQGPIKSVVVLVMENRSFDHVLGWLKSVRPEIDGLTGKESNRVSVSDPNSEEVFVSNDAIFIDSDPGHSFQAIREQIFGSNDSSVNPAPMNGFAQQAAAMDEIDMPKTVMSGFKPERVPVYTELANQFAVFDRWFASVPASTQPNRFYVHSATSHGAMSNVRKDLIHGFPQKTIFDSLDENGLTFGIYYQNIPATLFFKSLRKLKHIVKFHSYALKFKLHAKLGRLPNYAVIEQRYFDVDLYPANDDHPSHDVARGQKFVKEVYEILRASPQWKEMALLITYDEHGGFYDHVPTPVTGVPNPDGIIGPDPYYFRFDRLGVRVPTILVSPWVEKGTVIHEPVGPTSTSQFEHSSVPATVKKLFNLKSNFLTKRDAWAGTFDHYLKLRDHPRDDCPETLPKVTAPLRPWGPKEHAKLSEFQVELIQLASQLNGDHVLNSYPNIGKYMTVGEANKYAEDAVKRFLEAGRVALMAGANESAIVTMRPSLTSRTTAVDSGPFVETI